MSIVVNNFNYERFLAQSIDSALTQTYSCVEVLVVDDCSTDESRSVIGSYGDRVISVLQKQNRGQGAGFNAGFSASKGDIVMFLDADDWLYPNAVERIVSAWQSNYAKVHFRLDLVDGSGMAIDTHPAPEIRLDSGNVVTQLLEFGRYETVVTSGNAFARVALLATLPMPEIDFRIGADGYLATVVPFYGNIGCIDECLGAYRVHGANAYAGAQHYSAGALCLRMRNFLIHDEHKHRVLLAKATAMGRTLLGLPHMKDPNHLEMRIASLRLDPDQHPNSSDTRLNLAWSGVIASKRARLPWLRRVALGIWFVCAGILPRRLARPLIEWKLAPATRPSSVQRHFTRLRRLLN